jgi:serine/threonine protein kinase
MLERSEPGPGAPPPNLRAAADLAAGRTIALRPDEWSNALLRKELPSLIAATSKPGEQAPSSAPRNERPQFGKYEVLGEIAQGGMSTVYLARDPVLDRLVALKVLQHIGASDEGNRARERLLREARAMASLTHPHIVRMYDVVEGRDGLGLAMEWVDGLTLAQLLRQLPAQETPQDMATIAGALGAASVEEQDASATRWLVRSLRDVALAVHHVHTAGLLHLDIKPSNILLRRDGTALLADFGVVREIDLLLSRTGTFTGTPIYAAPEQFLRKGTGYNAATDVYGLGITLYEALARAQPIQEASLATLLRHLETGRVPPLASRCRVPSDLANIVHKAIHPEPLRRYQTAAEFAADLTAFLASRPVSAHRPSRTERLRRWLRHEPWKALAAGVLLVSVPVVGGLGWKVLGDRPKLAQLRAESLRREADKLIHRGTQALLEILETEESASPSLRRALELTPDAVLPLGIWGIASKGQQDRDFAAALQRHLAKPAPHPFLTALADRAREGRRTFTAAELQNLRATSDPQQLLLLALDDLSWSLMAGQLQGEHQPRRLLERAHALSREQHPLVVGLLAYLSAALDKSEAGQYERYRATVAAIWPDDPELQLWIFDAERARDPQAARLLLADVSRRFPTHDGVQFYRLRQHLDDEDWQAAEEWLAQVPASPGLVRWTRLQVAVGKKDLREAHRLACQILSDVDYDLPTRVLQASAAAPDEARPYLARWVAETNPTYRQIRQIMSRLEAPEDLAKIELAIRKAIALRMPLWAELDLLYEFGARCRDFRRAAALLRSVDGYESLPIGLLPRATTLLARGQRWREAVTVGDHHFAKLTAPEDRRHASSALAIAHARLGDRAAAGKYVDIHLALAPRGGHFEVHLEHAALLLQEPDQLAAAQKILDDLDRNLAARNNPRPPYMQLVLSRAARLAGDTSAARELLQSAEAELRARIAALPERPRREEWSAPRDLAEQIAAGLAELATAAAAPEAPSAGDKR